MCGVVLGLRRAALLGGALVVLGALGLASLSMLRPEVIDAAVNRIASVADEGAIRTSGGWRRLENEASAARIAQSPLFGIGLGGEYRPWLSEIRNFSEHTRYVHNGYVFIALGRAAVAEPVAVVVPSASARVRQPQAMQCGAGELAAGDGPVVHAARDRDAADGAADGAGPGADDPPRAVGGGRRVGRAAAPLKVMARLPHCTAVVLNWNGWRDTLNCVHSLLRAEPAPGRIVVCDNGSTGDSLPQLDAALRGGGDGSAHRARALTAPTGGIWLVKRRQPGGGNGGPAGFHATRPAAPSGPLGDTEVAPATGQALALCAPRSACAARRWSTRACECRPGRVGDPAGPAARHLGALRRLDEPPPTRRRRGADGHVRRGDAGAPRLAQTRPIPTTTSREIDWAARRGRFRLGWAPGSIVFHQEGASIGTAAQGGSPLSLYYLYRNRQRFAWRCHRAFMPTVLLSTAWDIAKLAARARWPQVQAALRGTLQLGRPAAGAQR
jgi:hypothetical protein